MEKNRLELPYKGKYSGLLTGGGIVRSFTDLDNDTLLAWGIKIDSGEVVSSGVYYIRFEGDGGDKIIKVAVQR